MLPERSGHNWGLGPRIVTLPISLSSGIREPGVLAAVGSIEKDVSPCGWRPAEPLETGGGGGVGGAGCFLGFTHTSPCRRCSTEEEKKWGWGQGVQHGTWDAAAVQGGAGVLGAREDEEGRW